MSQCLHVVINDHGWSLMMANGTAHRYNVVLKQARKEGLRKGLSVSLVTGGIFLILYSMYALGFW